MITNTPNARLSLGLRVRAMYRAMTDRWRFSQWDHYQITANNGRESHVSQRRRSYRQAVHLALCTADPNDAGTGASCNEVANTGNYARTAIMFGAAANEEVSNKRGCPCSRPQTGAWGTATHWVVTDSGDVWSGNVLCSWRVSRFRRSSSPGTRRPSTSGSVKVLVADVQRAQRGAITAVHAILDFIVQEYGIHTTGHLRHLDHGDRYSDDERARRSHRLGVISRVLVSKNGGSVPNVVCPGRGGAGMNTMMLLVTGFNERETETSVAVCDARVQETCCAFDNTVHGSGRGRW